MTIMMRSVLLVAGIVGTAACGRLDPVEEWDGGAARAVARRVDASQDEGRLVVLSTLRGSGGDELPWSVRQSLTTAGFELGDSTVLNDPDVRLLVFDRAERADTVWTIHTRTLQRGAPPMSVIWLVRCGDDACEVIEP
jgi:hypothetical protein